MLAIQLPLGLRLAGFSAKMVSRLSNECTRFGCVNFKDGQPSYYARVDFSNSSKNDEDIPIMLYVMFNPYMKYEKAWWEETIDTLYKDVLKAYQELRLSLSVATKVVSSEDCFAISKFMVGLYRACYVLTPLVVNDFEYTKRGLTVTGDFRLILQMDFSLTRKQIQCLYECKDSIFPRNLQSPPLIFSSYAVFKAIAYNLYYRLYSYKDGEFSTNIYVDELSLNKEESVKFLPKIIECSATKD